MFHPFPPSLCVHSYISKVDVLKILVTANYKYVPSLDDILETSAVTRLRNQLLEAEHYRLAVEVSRQTNRGILRFSSSFSGGRACLNSEVCINLLQSLLLLLLLLDAPLLFFGLHVVDVFVPLFLLLFASLVVLVPLVVQILLL